MEMGWENLDWFYLVQDRIWWWTPVNTVMNLQVFIKVEDFSD
jgi:hypothetical protein